VAEPQDDPWSRLEHLVPEVESIGDTTGEPVLVGSVLGVHGLVRVARGGRWEFLIGSEWKESSLTAVLRMTGPEGLADALERAMVGHEPLATRPPDSDLGCR
jgi:hypothetical protein